MSRPDAQWQPIETEAWLPVVGWEGLYEVSSFGRVRSLPRRVVRADGTVQNFSGKLLTPTLNTNGYLVVRLSRLEPRTRLSARVHRLVAQAFLPNPAGLPEVNHKDSDRANPRVTNLEWVTPSSNRLHGYHFGSVALPHRPGERNNAAKLNWEIVATMRSKHAAGGTIKGLAREYGVHKKTVSDVVKMVSWLPAPPSDAQREGE